MTQRRLPIVQQEKMLKSAVSDYIDRIVGGRGLRQRVITQPRPIADHLFPETSLPLVTPKQNLRLGSSTSTPWLRRDGRARYPRRPFHDPRFGSAVFAAVAQAVRQAEAHGERQMACRRNLHRGARPQSSLSRQYGY